jgi:hypothetical protein
MFTNCGDHATYMRSMYIIEVEYLYRFTAPWANSVKVFYIRYSYSIKVDIIPCIYRIPDHSSARPFSRIFSSIPPELDSRQSLSIMVHSKPLRLVCMVAYPQLWKTCACSTQSNSRLWKLCLMFTSECMSICSGQVTRAQMNLGSYAIDIGLVRSRSYIHWSLNIIYMLAKLFVSTLAYIGLLLHICP